jgi:peptidoglycan/xylan/chitin deacetylase (PgdA/CDA1 family)
MINALLTIDGVPENSTIEILDYLYKRHIPAILFTIGEKASIHPEILIYAINHGFIIGNHSYTHPHFSDLTLDEAIAEIEKTDAVIDRIYADSGIARHEKLFRFPYLDEGGSIKTEIFSYLTSHGFVGPFGKCHVPATYDCEEYNIRPGSNIDLDYCLRKVEREFLSTNPDYEVILIHSHDETKEMAPDYFETLIEKIESRDVIWNSFHR